MPSDIGIIDNECIYWMHTHDDTGIIHIESPEKRNFTLGEFFDIWNQNFSNSQIFDNTVDGSGNSTLNVYVNGRKMTAGSDYRQIPINAHDEIAIVFGKPPDSYQHLLSLKKGCRVQTLVLAINCNIMLNKGKVHFPCALDCRSLAFQITHKQTFPFLVKMIL